MAADVALDRDALNPCCEKLRKKILKLEGSRNALRQAVQILELQVNKLESENSNLKKACEQHMIAEQGKKAKEEDPGIILKLEQEISDLKAEITANQQQESKDHRKMLDASTSEKDAVIKMLKEELAKEKTRGDTEMKKVELERKRVADMRKLLVMDKRKADEDKKFAQAERKKSEELRISLEKLKTEMNEARSKLVAETARARELDKLIEKEKQKSIVEKKRADFEREKAEKLDRALEAQCSATRGEKILLENMRQMVEDEKQKKEELQKKLIEVLPEQGATNHCQCSHAKQLKGDKSPKGDAIKSLKQLLKFENKQLKHAKRVAKLEKAEKRFFSDQYHLLRRDFLQISCHLKMLGDRLSYRSEGTNRLTKADGSSDALRTDLQNITSCLLFSETNIQPGNCCKASSHIPGSTRERSSFDAAGLGCIGQISGVKSDLTRNSSRRKKQSSTVCSTSTICTDRGIMASQGVDAAIFATSSKQTEGFFNQKLMIPNLQRSSSVDTQIKTTVAEEGTWNKVGIQTNFDDGHKSSSVNEGKNKIVSGCGKKRKRHQQLVSAKALTDKDKQFHLESVEKVVIGKDIMRIKAGRHTEIRQQMHGSKFTNDRKDLLIGMHDDKCRCQKSFKCADDKLRTFSQQLCCQDKKDKLENSYSVLPPPNKSGSMSLKINEKSPSHETEKQAVSIEQTDLFFDENIKCGNYMKLLELHNEEDEIRYREAIQRPISPTLPDIRFSNSQLGKKDKSLHLMEELLGKHGSGEDDLEHYHCFDVIDLEINSNKLELATSAPATSKDIKLSQASEESELDDILTIQRDLNKHEMMGNNANNHHSVSNVSLIVGKVSDAREQDVLMNNADSSFSLKKSEGTSEVMPLVSYLVDPYAVPGLRCINSMTRGNALPPFAGDNFLSPGKADNCQTSNSSTMVGCESTLHSSAIQELQNPCETNVVLEGASVWCVTLLDTKDEDNVSRIVQARNTIASDSFRGSEVDCRVMEALRSLESIVELQPEEKVCVLFSLMLDHIYGLLFANSGTVKMEDILRFTESFVDDIYKVFSNAEDCQLFLTNCQLDILLNLIEDFLTRRMILKCDRMVPNNSCSSFVSGNLHHLKGQNMFVTEISAKIGQLLAASIFSAAVCVALGQISFLVEVSYRILRFCKHDAVYNLLMLQIFVFASGEKFFTLDKYRFLANIIKSVVLLLEGGHEAQLSCSSTCDIDVSFSPCDQCPFSKNALPAEKIAASLMDILHDFAIAGGSSASYSFASSLYPAPECSNGVKEPDVLGIECEASCVIFKYSDQFPKRILCYYTDVVSSVELFSYYMGWKWTSDILLPRLFAMLKLCHSNELSAATIVLIGQLGRFGIDCGGYQQVGISELRCNLASILDTYIKEKSNLPNQLAVVDAIVNLLPIKFGEIIGGCYEHAVDANQTQQLELVKKWFSQLENKMRRLASNYFGYADLAHRQFVHGS